MYNEKLISNDILDEKTYHYVLKDGLNVYICKINCKNVARPVAVGGRAVLNGCGLNADLIRMRV